MGWNHKSVSGKERQKTLTEHLMPSSVPTQCFWDKDSSDLGGGMMNCAHTIWYVSSLCVWRTHGRGKAILGRVLLSKWCPSNFSPLSFTTPWGEGRNCEKKSLSAMLLCAKAPYPSKILIKRLTGCSCLLHLSPLLGCEYTGSYIEALLVLLCLLVSRPVENHTLSHEFSPCPVMCISCALVLKAKSGKQWNYCIKSSKAYK